MEIGEKRGGESYPSKIEAGSGKGLRPRKGAHEGNCGLGGVGSALGVKDLVKRGGGARGIRGGRGWFQNYTGKAISKPKSSTGPLQKGLVREGGGESRSGTRTMCL